MTKNQLIANLENKISKIQENINNWEKEIMEYKNKLQEIIKVVAELKSNYKN